ncbi:hypothetical protein C2845_PM15G08310 [Panicum miliaceum]|uniref:Ubiquitin carboxyl-terminal hydrolase n=1 Tax=Panicum miliaceum TaxID=4540 RepID=A0A3L6Q615_PANMI|nr:hypothetical protein C2845_PM15G08310 [Panicum miliaceum]
MGPQVQIMGKFMCDNPLVSPSEVNRHNYSLAAVAVGLGLGVAGLCKALYSGLSIPWVSPRNLFLGSGRVYYVGGLRNLGNNCFLNVILQALASCDSFVSFLDNLLATDGLLPEEKAERMPLLLALSSLLEAFNVLPLFATQLSLDFQNFQCLPLSPALNTNGDITSGCSLVDCLKYFTVVEHLDNYRCDRCWHITAAKYLSLKSEADEGKVSKLNTCVDYGTCSCRGMFSPEEIPCSSSSRATKQLIISQCPKILCIHLLRASVSLDGEPIKHQGHISFPLLLNLSPFAGGASSIGQGSGPLAMNVQRDGQQALHLYRQLNMQMSLNVIPTGGNSVHVVGFGYSTFDILANVDVASSSSSSLQPSPSSSRSKLYGLSAVVEHYGKCGGGHYAVYRRVASNPDSEDPEQPLAGLGKRWFYISDGHVSEVSEDDVLGAEATLLFYERL